MRWRSSFREAVRSLRAAGWTVWLPAAVLGAWLLAMPVYLATVYYAFVWQNPDLIVVDYSFFHHAERRFVHNPLVLYADPEYLYPPPAVLAFIPTTWVPLRVGYVMAGPMIAVQIALAAWGALRLWERERGRVLPSAVRWALVIVALGSGPAFQNLRYAQVNVLMLLTVLAFLALVQRERPGWGALALTAGFWLKLLPLALLPLGLSRRWPRLAMGAAAGLVLVPLALLPVVPLELYREYLFERLPTFSGITDVGPMANSIQASLTRLTVPESALVRGLKLPATAAASAAAGLVGVTVLAAAVWSAWTGRVGRVRAGFVILAILPAVIPLGWEYTFILALPLLLVALVEARERAGWVQALVGLAAFAFWAQRLPPPQMQILADALPRGVLDLYLARLWLAVLGLVALGLAGPVGGGARESPGASAAPGLLRGIRARR
ncbi:MAG TPA: DUF2029 domain-containing protein [Rhodothermales bacterium]|nr:DUF2029 domain-containing protein [Rhodothermales bacterium]